MDEFDETDFTGRISRALEAYLIIDNPERLDGICTPGPRRQNPENIDYSYCADLIAQIDDARILLLEVKIHRPTTNSLPSYDAKQHTFLKAIEDFGVPVRYCYNSTFAMSKMTFVQALASCRAPTPGQLKMENLRVKEWEKHETLLSALNSLMSDASEAFGALAVLTDAGFLERVHELNTKMLIFIAHVDRDLVRVLDQEEVGKLVEYAKKFDVSLSRRKFSNMDADEIVDHFKERMSLLGQYVIRLRPPPEPQKGPPHEIS
jgi:hypothetical protein